MSIQGNVNQLIAQSGVLMHLNPELQAKAENRAKYSQLSKQKKVLSEQQDIVGDEQRGIEKDMEKAISKTGPFARAIEDDLAGKLKTNIETQVDLAERQEDIAREIFDVKPSAKTYKDYAFQKSYTGFTKDALSDITKSRETRLATRDRTPEEVNNNMATKGAEKIKQKIKFADTVRMIKKEDL